MNQLVVEEMIGYKKIDIPDLTQSNGDLKEEVRESITAGKYLPGSKGAGSKALVTTATDIPGVRYEYIIAKDDVIPEINEESPNKEDLLVDRETLIHSSSPLTVANAKARSNRKSKSNTSGRKKNPAARLESGDLSG